MTHDHVLIAVNYADPPGVENVPAIRLSDDKWKLIRSPLYATEVASDDIIRIIDQESGNFEILERGGNVCVHFYLAEKYADDEKATIVVSNELSSKLKDINGKVDAMTPGLISLTIPITAGFDKIEKIIDNAVKRNPGAQWEYINVYDPATNELLGWWNK